MEKKVEQFITGFFEGQPARYYAKPCTIFGLSDNNQ
jgi:hypothetical protein